MKYMITPDWPAPSNIQAYTTLRNGGNLATHLGANEKQVQANRQLLKARLHLENEPIWLEQTHSTIVLPAVSSSRNKQADASFTNQTLQICVVTTADCLPILLCHRNGTHVAAIHAGWRGLASGIIENTLKAMNLNAEDILVWLGPAIGPVVYEVGEEVRQRFMDHDLEAEKAFIPSTKKGHWLGNLYDLATLRFHKQNILAIYGGQYCTYTDKERFYSYRREGDKAGRMASLIWIT